MSKIPHQQVADNYIIELGTRRSQEDVRLIVDEAEKAATDANSPELTRGYLVAAVQALIRHGIIGASDQHAAATREGV